MVHSTSWSLRTSLIALVALALRCPARVDAQRTIFTSGIDMMPLTVTVTDSAGKYVTGLTGDHLTVFEDGVRQPLSFFASDEVPVDLALVLDTSGSMRTDLPIIQSAANGLVRRLRPNDRSAVVEVNNTAGIPQPFTSDHSSIEAAIRKLATSGSTALYDTTGVTSPSRTSSISPAAWTSISTSSHSGARRR
jgi:VWFA-related protein